MRVARGNGGAKVCEKVREEMEEWRQFFKVLLPRAVGKGWNPNICGQKEE